MESALSTGQYRDCDVPESSMAVILGLGQVVIALSGGEILYFEIDESHTLNEVAKRDMNYEASPESHFSALTSAVPRPCCAFPQRLRSSSGP